MPISGTLEQEALALPVEMRAELIDRLLHSIHPCSPDIDRLWAIEAERRVAEIGNDKVRLLPGQDVFEKIRQEYG